jgi:RHS repeat-associated protein
MGAINYAWNPIFDCVTHETDDAGNVIAEYTHEPKVHGQLISQHRNGVSSVYHYDALGTTRALTDSNQNVTDTAVYTAFGEKVASTGTTLNPFGYVGAMGYHTSPSTGDIYVRARNYEPQLARWESADPLFIYNSVQFKYAHNAPTRYVDPSGLRPPKVDDDPKCCECKKASDLLRQWYGVTIEGTEYIRVEGPIDEKTGKPTYCSVAVFCQTAPCRTNRTNVFGYTSERTDRESRIGDIWYNITICVTCDPRSGAILAHEVIHAKQFCKGDKISDEASCLKLEGEAHAKSCKWLWPEDEAKQKICTECGTLVSCALLAKPPKMRPWKKFIDGIEVDCESSEWYKGPITPQ